MARPSHRAQEAQLRERMRDLGMSHDEVATELARRYRYRPRTAFRHALGWTLKQAAEQINSRSAAAGMDPTGRATMTAAHLCEYEAWPASSGRRPSPQFLALLALVYDTDVHRLIDIDDREHLDPADLLLVSRIVREAPGRPGYGTKVDDAGGARRPAMSSPACSGTSLPDQPGVVENALAASATGVAGPEAGARAGSEDGEQPTNRRDVLTAAGASALAALLAESAVESSVIGQRWEQTDLGPATLEQLDLAVERFGLSYLRTPPERLFAEVRACRQRVVSMLAGKQTLSQRRSLYVVAGWLSGLLGHLALDLGSSAVAYAHCVTAWQLAQETGDARLGGWVRGTQAMVACYDDDAAEAVRFARAGQDLAPRDSFVLVRLLAQEARAQARLGDAGQVEAAFSLAEETYACVAERPSRSIFSFDRPYLPFYAGTAYVWLRRPQNAQRHAEEAVSLCDASAADWPVARALARIDLALSLAQQGEPERACSVGTEALDIYLVERPVDLISRRAAEVARELAPYGSLHHVQEFQERQLTVSRRFVSDGSGKGATSQRRPLPIDR